MMTKPTILRTKGLATAVIRMVIPAKDMAKYMDPAIQEILQVLSEQNMVPAGPMFSYHHRRPTETFDFELGFPIAAKIKESGRVVNSILPAVNVARCIHQGPYENLGSAWGELEKWVQDQDRSGSGRFWECYLNDPTAVKSPEEYRTELNWVIAGSDQ